MSQGENDDKEALGNFMKAIAGKINYSDRRTEALFSSACIYKVPEDLRKLNKSAYTPRVIAIGPLHRKDKHLQNPMEHVKKRYTHQLLARTTSGIPLALEQCVKKMKEKNCVDRARKYYAAELTVSDDQMSEMMLFDGCFILKLLYSTHRVKIKEAGRSNANGGDSDNSKASSSVLSGGEDGGKQADPIFDCILTANIVKHDLLLFENQIPFFVLDELFKLTVDKIPDDEVTGVKKLSLIEYVVWYFSDIMSPPDDENSGSEKKTSCFTCSPSDCVRWACGSAKENEQGKKDDENSGSETKTGCCLPSESSDCVLWFSGSCSTKKNKQVEKEPGKASDYYHILHLLHEYYLPANQEENSTGCSPRCCTIPGCCSHCHCTNAGCFSPCCSTVAGCCSPCCCTPVPKKSISELEVCASDLDYAGVKFEPVNFEGNSLFDIKFEERQGLCWWFHRATFQIPTLSIHDPTEPFFRNLIALEQCCPGVSRYFTSYAKFMDMLINSEKDVQVLKKAKVIHNYFGTDEDVSNLFNKLCKEVVLPQFCFKEACQKASEYSDRCWPRYMAYLRRTYFASPWAFIGFCLALIAFGIQITNFIRSFLK